MYFGRFRLYRVYCNNNHFHNCVAISQISLTVSQKQRDGKEVPLVKVVIDCLGTNLQLRTFDLKVSAYLGGIYVQHMQFKGIYMSLYIPHDIYTSHYTQSVLRSVLLVLRPTLLCSIIQCIYRTHHANLYVVQLQNSKTIRNTNL